MGCRLPLICALPLILAFAAGMAGAAEDGQVTFTKHVAPFLQKYCTRCHGGSRPKADLAFDKFKDEAAALQKRAVWERILTNVRSGDMPPSGRRKPKSAEVKQLADWIHSRVAKVDCSKERDPGRITLRRLNRAEYNNTIRDLVGVNFKPADDFPIDDVGYGFDNIGDVLSLSPLLLEKYLSAAEKVVDLAWQNPDARRRILIRPPNSKEAAWAILNRFARRAFRRPVSPDEVGHLVRLVELAEQNGEPAEKGIQLALQAVLVSPHFLFKVEQNQPVKKAGDTFPINDFELATRLSYFLWSSMPDEDLFRLAEQKALREPRALEAQVRRMLADTRSSALVENFAGQWLQLRNLKTLNPDPGHFPDFDESLRSAMIRETELFFAAVVREDRGVLDFLDADFTFVNERLARHYGIPGVKGSEFRRVSLADTPRGGIVTQASILTVTSNPTRTSPVKRGKWILENILGTPPPPPPPDAGELNESKEAVLKGTLRQRMEMHRAKPLCASCHQRMDPLGFGLENFDGIGKWRTKDGNFRIDASGALPGGEKFDGPKGLRAVLKGKQADFRRCLAEKVLTYALGRGLEYYDKCAVDDICKSLVQNQDRFSALVLAVVRSEPFQMRRGVLQGGRRR